MKKYHGYALGHWITVLFESKGFSELRLISVFAFAHFLPVNAMESVKKTH